MPNDEVKWKRDVYPGTSLNYSSLKEALKVIQEALAAEARGEWKDLHIETGHGYDEGSIHIYGLRPETSHERANREAEELRREQSQREEYEKLKKKFEGA